jgi:hypothetical protein
MLSGSDVGGMFAGLSSRATSVRAVIAPQKTAGLSRGLIAIIERDTAARERVVDLDADVPVHGQRQLMN